MDPAWGGGRQTLESRHCPKASEERCCWAEEVELCSPLLPPCTGPPLLCWAQGGHGSALSDGAAELLCKRPCRQQPECAWKEDGATVVLGPWGLAAVSVNKLHQNLWGQKSNKITEDKPMLPLCTFHLSSNFILPSFPQNQLALAWPCNVTALFSLVKLRWFVPLHVTAFAFTVLLQSVCFKLRAP